MSFQKILIGSIKKKKLDKLVIKLVGPKTSWMDERGIREFGEENFVLFIKVIFSLLSNFIKNRSPKLKLECGYEIISSK